MMESTTKEKVPSHEHNFGFSFPKTIEAASLERRYCDINTALISRRLGYVSAQRTSNWMLHRLFSNNIKPQILKTTILATSPQVEVCLENLSLISRSSIRLATLNRRSAATTPACAASRASPSARVVNAVACRFHIQPAAFSCTRAPDL